MFKMLKKLVKIFRGYGGMLASVPMWLFLKEFIRLLRFHEDGVGLTFVQALILGVVQGLTEWLPISSEGLNTLILLNVFNVPLAKAIFISVWLHTGTLLAAIIYFRKDLIGLLKYLPRYFKAWRVQESSEGALTSFLIVSTILTGVVGLPLMHLALVIDVPSAFATGLIGMFLIATGVLQRYSRFFKGFGGRRLRLRDGVLLGFVQGLSILPGLSRSGLTIATLLFRGYGALEAVRLSFLMSIPAIFMAEVGLWFIFLAEFSLPLIIGSAASFTIGFLTINAFMKLASEVSFWKFCFFLGVLSILGSAILTSS